ncbi:MAG TPA: hypothetical protein VJ984_14600 [Xanthomonadales bacterium]|nr:hypothetical protein [Xanthomonadales bacterium]
MLTNVAYLAHGQFDSRKACSAVRKMLVIPEIDERVILEINQYVIPEIAERLSGTHFHARRLG